MKSESDPITEDEWLIRLVWETRVTDKTPIIEPNSFEPRKDETDGISFFRTACLAAPADALAVIAEEKRPRYAIVLVPVSLMSQLGLVVAMAPIDKAAGHVVIANLNWVAYKADKKRFTPIMLRLAEVASQNILRRPA
jgi:hypothetical protein